MGYAILYGTCVCCHKPFSFNPNFVPSIRVNEKKEPICKECINKANPIRVEKGLEPIIIHPEDKLNNFLISEGLKDYLNSSYSDKITLLYNSIKYWNKFDSDRAKEKVRTAKGLIGYIDQILNK